MRLEEKVALVSGASSGIGKAVAYAYAKEGAKVAAIGRNKERLAQTKKEIVGVGGSCITFEADLTQPDNVDKSVRGTVEAFGRLDILFNAAGIAEFSPYLDVTEELFDQVMNINLKSQFFLSQRAAKEMVKQGGGKVICMSSVAGGVFGVPNLIVYCASKGAVVSMVRALAVELAPYKINVNALCPGHILTPINEEKFQDPEYKNAMLALVPLGQIGSTSDVTPAAIYLASEDSNYVTGTHFIIDGGASAMP